jgi:D-galactarolactone cycloisomerase
MKIIDVQAFPVSVPIPADKQNKLGIGRLTKRDAVFVKVTTDDELVGWGEAHHGRNPGAVANIVQSTMRELVMGMDASNVSGIWRKVYQAQFASHGMGAGSIIALSGVDMALWDLRGKATGWPVHKLLGGASKPILAYAGGGGSLGFGETEALLDEVRSLMARNYKAVKLRVGQSPMVDLDRIEAVRNAFGDELIILTDANTGYSLEDVRAVMPGLDAMDVGWLEEPFPGHDHRSYAVARSYGTTPFALGENTYTRYEFLPHIESGNIGIMQPDVGKTGGFTEIMRIAALAAAYNIPLHPHGGVTGLDLAAGIHVLAAVDNPGYFESSEGLNPLREGPFLAPPYEVGEDGCVRPLEAPGLGLEVNEEFLRAHPVIEGPGFV